MNATYENEIITQSEVVKCFQYNILQYADKVEI